MKDEYNFSDGKRGAVVPTTTGKTRITIRLDSDIIYSFRNQAEQQGGGNYQTMINDALRDHLRNDKETLEDVIRRIIEERLSGHSIAIDKVIFNNMTAKTDGFRDLPGFKPESYESTSGMQSLQSQLIFT